MLPLKWQIAKPEFDRSCLFINRLKIARAKVSMHFDRRTNCSIRQQIQFMVWFFLGGLGVLAVSIKVLLR